MVTRKEFLKKGLLLAGSIGLGPEILAQNDTSKEDAALKPPTNQKKYRLPYKNTYVKNTFVTDNSFRNQKPDSMEIPDFKQIKDKLPQPFWSGNDKAIELYWFIWETAFKNIKKPTVESGFISTYIDTAYNGNIFMWDSAFITMFARYGSRAFPFQNTLNNFYAKQHADGFISREIMGDCGEDAFHRYDPVSTGPNVIPWSEIVYYKQFGDLERLHKIFAPLSGYYQWLRKNRTWQDGSYWASGWATGMDNIPRLEPGYDINFSNGHMVWLDTCLQQLYVGKILMDIGFYTERWQEIEDIEDEIKFLKKYIKEKLWNSKDAFFYDLYKNGKQSNVKFIGAYWALLTDILSKEELDKFVAHLNDPKLFKRPFMVPSLSYDNPKYQEDGRYWQGGIWAPTNYMVIKGLQKNNYNKMAFDIAVNHHSQVLEVYKQTGTVWEYYAPEKADKGLLARPDFVGWTGLPPVAVMIEAIFGFNIDFIAKTIDWNINLTDEFGVKNIPIGTEDFVSFKCLKRENKKQAPKIEIETSLPLTLNLSWNDEKKTIKINKGVNQI